MVYFSIWSKIRGGQVTLNIKYIDCDQRTRLMSGISKTCLQYVKYHEILHHSHLAVQYFYCGFVTGVIVFFYYNQRGFLFDLFIELEYSEQTFWYIVIFNFRYVLYSVDELSNLLRK